MSFATYAKTLAASLFAMFAGAQLVHLWYRPDLSIPEIPPKKGELHTKLYMSWTQNSTDNSTDSDAANAQNNAWFVAG